MPGKIEKDTATGTETTGHEWDGISEDFHCCNYLGLMWAKWTMVPSTCR